MANEWNSICPALSYQKDTTANFVDSSFPKWISFLSLHLSFSATSHVDIGCTLIQNLTPALKFFFVVVKRKVCLESDSVTSLRATFIPSYIARDEKGFIWDFHMKCIVKIPSVLFKCILLWCACATENLIIFSENQRHIKICVPNCLFIIWGNNTSSNNINQIIAFSNASQAPGRVSLT